MRSASKKMNSEQIIESMSKDELVWWVREKCFMHHPKMSDILFYRWQASVRRNQQTMNTYLAEAPERQKEAERIDELFLRMRTETNHKTLALLLSEAQGLRDKLIDSHARWDKLMKAEKRTQALYNEIDKARKEEAACRKI